MKNLVFVFVVTILAGCATTASIESASGQSTTIRKVGQISASNTVEISDTTFGNYDFKVVGKNNKVMYGILPLNMHPGRAVLDVLFFAPGLFFNLRTAFAYYHFDADKGVVKYRNDPSDEWMVYSPSSAESTRAKRYFEK